MNGRNKAMCYTKDIHSYRKFSRNQSKEGISMSSIETFLQMVKESDNIVFFGGAGVSTESGIPVSGAWMDFTIRSMIIHRKRS